MPHSHNPNHLPRLRLRRDDESDAREEQAVVFPFPGAKVRERLVAGRVEGDPRRDAPPPDDDGASRLRLTTGEDEDVVVTADLVRQIEHTLDRMQARLAKLRRQMDGAHKFPGAGGSGSSASGDDWRPRAA